MPTLTFLGAAESVTGSRFLLEANGVRLLVDCGLYQEREFAGRNWDPFPIDPNTIDAVLLTHAHLDHSGYLPKLVRDGFQGPIYCTAATAELVQILLEDSAHIQEEDAAFKKRRHQRERRRGAHPEVPLYTVADALAVTNQLNIATYGESVELHNGVRATFWDAGHIVGSASVEVWFPLDGADVRVVFSGDLGRRNRPIVHDPDTYKHADYVVMESTYGDRLHPPAESAANRLAAIINETFKKGGKLLIPAFAVERAQEVLYHLAEVSAAGLVKNLKVFMDSPMATDVTKVFERHPEFLDPPMADMLNRGESPFRFPGLSMVQTVEQSKAIKDMDHPVVVIAGAGMCTGGRIKHHLVNHISDPRTTVLFVGYQAQGTLGRQIVDGKESVRIHGQMHDVNARIEVMADFSAHADRDGLLRWVSSVDVPPKRVFVVHGEREVSANFAALVQQQAGWKTTVPHYNQSVALS